MDGHLGRDDGSQGNIRASDGLTENQTLQSDPFYKPVPPLSLPLQQPGSTLGSATFPA